MVLGDRVLMRDHRLAAVDVNSRPGCDAQPERLRRYDFSYQVDPDTRQERLASVKMLGRQGTPEANVSLPVADYSYGSATTSDSTGRNTTLQYGGARRSANGCATDREVRTGFFARFHATVFAV